jgi:hypothetical protein
MSDAVIVALIAGGAGIITAIIAAILPSVWKQFEKSRSAKLRARLKAGPSPHSPEMGMGRRVRDLIQIVAIVTATVMGLISATAGLSDLFGRH